ASVLEKVIDSVQYLLFCFSYFVK
ncbi:hypothetical protein A2U01_0112038, partial [Trifolium medium]|nr:hypothetical protein [Trifolium medium]